MAITTQDQLIQYCYRELGSPVINIEVDMTQAIDRVSDAVQFFNERHFDGTEEVWYHKTVSYQDALNGFLTIPAEYSAMIDILAPSANGSGVDNLDNFQFHFMENLNAMMSKHGGNTGGQISNYFIQMSHLDMIQNMLTQDFNFDYNATSHMLRPRFPLNSIGSNNMLKDATDLTTSNWTTSNCSVAGGVLDQNGENKAFSVTSTGAGLFSISQTITTKRYVRGTYTAVLPIAKGTYAGNLTVTISDANGVVATSTITPDSLWKDNFLEVVFPVTSANDIILKVEGTAIGVDTFNMFMPTLYLNKTLIIHGYKNITASNSSIYDNRWLKKYATSLIKRQWGNNLKKMSGVQMPGGIELNGQAIFDEAEQEIAKLMEDFQLDYQTLPPDVWA